MTDAAIHLCKALARILSSLPNSSSANRLLTALADFVVEHEG